MPTARKALAVVGLGAWGCCVLERVVETARDLGATVEVHVVQPGGLAGGIYRTDQPDYLVLNNACGQLSLAVEPFTDPSRPYVRTLFEWAVERGYRWVGHRCLVGAGGRALDPGDYLPRRLMGEYLEWFYDAVVAHAPPLVTVVPHDAAALDAVALPDGREVLQLSDGARLVVDHVIITTGHTWNEEPSAPGRLRELRPYPVDHFDRVIAPASSVAVSGLGLVAYDLVTALTIGRGGRHVAQAGDRLRYLRSGREPVIYLYSRSGVPSAAKPIAGTDRGGAYDPVVCTRAALGQLRRDARGRARAVDFRAEVLPLLFDEMRVRYLRQSVLLREGEAAAQVTARSLHAAAAEGRLASALAPLEDRHGRLVPENHFFPFAGRIWASAKDYESTFYDATATDLDHALDERGSPVKAAEELTRVLRDELRSVVELRALTLSSYLDFQSRIRSRITRLDAGPPPMRSQELLALMDAGVVRVPFGPNPRIALDDTGLLVGSTAFDEPERVRLDGVLRGHLEMPTLATSASPLIQNLYRRGRLSEHRYGEVSVGSVAMDEEFHPLDQQGRRQEALVVLGVLTEGIRFFTHYIPSPKSRLRAVQDATNCVQRALDPDACMPSRRSIS